MSGPVKQFDSLVSIRITQETHDRLIREAMIRQIALSDLLRERLQPVSQDRNRPRTVAD
jgi:predicted DNA-binding protein